jgi:hypothetical protein
LDNWKKIWNLEYQEPNSGRVTARFKERNARDMWHVWDRRKYISLLIFGREI